MSPKKASITEVAKLANVSITTVSRVMNDSSHPVNEDTRQRVLKAAKELSYSPSALAQAMVSKDTKIIGVIVGDTSDPYFASIVRGVEDVARSYGYVVIVCNSDRQPEIELRYLDVLDSYRVDGVIFTGSGLSDEAYIDNITPYIEHFENRGAAVITMGRHYFPSILVSYDNYQALKEAANHLVDLGHTRIAYVSGPEVLTSFESRLEGYIDSLNENGINFEPDYYFQGDFSYDSGQLAADRIMTMDRPPTAVLCANDWMAIGCLTALKRQGVAIPGDMSVMGIGDIDSSSYIEPSLTTVSLPLQDMGAMAMDCLIQQRAGNLTEQDLPVLPHEIIIRNSTGQAPHTE